MGVNMDNLTILIPFWNGHKTIAKLIGAIPLEIPVIVIDDQSDEPYKPNKLRQNLTVISSKKKGYFTGAVNLGISACDTDVLILNQDVQLAGGAWLRLLHENRQQYAIIGERIGGNHPAWPKGYVHGTFMFIRRDAIQKIGPMNASDYPLWGSTCEYQLRACRAGYEVLQMQKIPGFAHERGAMPYGESIAEMLQRRPQDRATFLATPPEISVIIPCYKQGRFLYDAINSLIGGPTSLGDFPPQTFQSFEVIIVDDQSPDETGKIGLELQDPLKAIRYIRRKVNGGTAAANNTGALAARGRYVTFMSADDMMEPERLETLYRAAQKDPSKVYYDDMQTFTDGQRRDVMKMREYDFENLLYKNFMHAGIFYKRETWQAVGGYPEIMSHGREDWAMNIRLGVNGYCGIHIPKAGYLYRRQDHNRTLINTTPTWRARFLAQIQSLYPDIYKGARPNMCCGQTAKVKAKSAPGTGGASRIVPMSAGAIVLEYTGTSFGTQTFYGPVTGARYTAGKSRKLVSVDPRDLATGHQTKKGLLELAEGGKALFKRYTVPQAEIEKAKTVSMETEPEAQRASVPLDQDSPVALEVKPENDDLQKQIVAAQTATEETLTPGVTKTKKPRKAKGQKNDLA